MRIGADPLGGASVAYWGEIADRFGLDLTVVNPVVDATFRFMTLDWDGKIRMDCSSPYAMASLIGRRDEFAIATGNDTDADRHGIVTPDGGLLNPNHYLAAAIDYLYRHRDGWPAAAAVGKTMVSSAIIDRVAEAAGRRLIEVPVGFKWFVPGLLDGRHRLRRRGERRGVVPVPGRAGMDHRQGRHHPGPARVRDHRGHRPARPASTTARSPPSSATPPTPGSTPRPPGSRRPPWPGSPPTRSAWTSWPVSRCWTG